MKFALMLNIDLPDHIAATMPQAPDLQAEFQELVNQSVAEAIAKWFSTHSVRSTNILLTVLDTDNPH